LDLLFFFCFGDAIVDSGPGSARVTGFGFLRECGLDRSFYGLSPLAVCYVSQTRELLFVFEV
jgi:hypothetical protein